MDAIRKLVSTAVILGNLPEKSGTNGSVLLIDDEEAARCTDEINAAILEFEALRKDAERYAWVRMLLNPVIFGRRWPAEDAKALDAAIDAVMAGKAPVLGAA